MSDLFSNLNTPCFTCTKCAELADFRTQIVKPTRHAHAKLLIIGEAPGRDEDIQGVGFVGSSGKTLDKILSSYGIQRNDYSLANICWCRPPNNRKPTQIEIDNCLPNLANLIIELKPKVILTVGATPTQVFCGKGNLFAKITERLTNCSSNMCEESAHYTLQPVLTHVKYIVPVPHTSPLAFNRYAPNGQKWGAIFTEQIQRISTML